jgi:hypothetical protein
MNTPLNTSLASLIAPNGTLRVAINLGNPVLAGLDAAGEPSGISADLSRALAAQLGVGIEWRIFKKADDSVQCVRSDEADIGFFAIDPVRGEGLHFSPPYVQIEGAYMVRNDSPLQSNDEVDQAEPPRHCGCWQCLRFVSDTPPETRSHRARTQLARRGRCFHGPATRSGSRRQAATASRRAAPARCAFAAGPLHGHPPSHGHACTAQRDSAAVFERFCGRCQAIGLGGRSLCTPPDTGRGGGPAGLSRTRLIVIRSGDKLGLDLSTHPKRQPDDLPQNRPPARNPA